MHSRFNSTFGFCFYVGDQHWTNITHSWLCLPEHHVASRAGQWQVAALPHRGGIRGLLSQPVHPLHSPQPPGDRRRGPAATRQPQGTPPSQVIDRFRE